MAAVCIRAAWRIVGVSSQPYLQAAGFAVHHGSLVPPPDWQDRIAPCRDPQAPPGC
jgi:hypothetical protein